MQAISESTIGRLIKDLKAKGKIIDCKESLRLNAASGKLMQRKKKLEKKLRRKGYIPKQPGDLVQMDSITYFTEGIKRYFITAVDLVTGFGFAYTYPKLNSLNESKMFLNPFTLICF